MNAFMHEVMSRQVWRNKIMLCKLIRLPLTEPDQHLQEEETLRDDSIHGTAIWKNMSGKNVYSFAGSRYR